MRKKAVTPANVCLRDALLAVMREHSEKMPADEVLAVASHCVGRLLAAQNPRKYTVETAMALVMANIEAGNSTAMASLRDAAPAGHA